MTKIIDVVSQEEAVLDEVVEETIEEKTGDVKDGEE